MNLAPAPGPALSAHARPPLASARARTFARPIRRSAVVRQEGTSGPARHAVQQVTGAMPARDHRIRVSC